MADRTEFLAKIAEALGRTPGAPIAPPPPLEVERVRRVPIGIDPESIDLESGDSTTDRFAREVVAAGGECLRTPAGVLPATIAACLVDLEAARVIIDLPAEKLGLREACERVGIEVQPADGDRSAFESAGRTVGLTAVASAVAETGTVVLDASVGSPRGTSLLPDVHLAVVLESQIVPDLVDLLGGDAALSGEQPSARTWVTGPSKTADIEGILITGVHGPGEWIVAIAEGV